MIGPEVSAARPCEDCGEPGHAWEDGVIVCDDCALLRAKQWQMEREYAQSKEHTEEEFMSDWMDALTPAEREDWEGFVVAARREAVHKIAESAMVVSLVPGGESDIKFAVELGLAIMLDKPIVPVAIAGRNIPPGLRRVAHGVIEMENDFDTEAGQLEMQRKLSEIMGSLGLT